MCTIRNMETTKPTTSDLPRWAQRLADRHAEAPLPTREDPIPDWLEAEIRKTPLWYLIREAPGPRDRHPFILLEEIRREPDQWADIVATRWDDVADIAAWITDAGIERVIATGCGSAYFTAIHTEYVLPRLAGIPASAVESLELDEYGDASPAEPTLVLGHSGTGGSIETVDAMVHARERGYRTLAVANTDGSRVVAASERALVYETHQACGPCISVISTRILLVTMLGIELAKRRGRPVDPSIPEALGRLGSIGRAFLRDSEPAIKRLAQAYKAASSWFLVGSGPNYFTVREGTLKIEEQAILVAKAYRTGDFHHDALSLLDPTRPVIAVQASGAANDRVIDVLRASREAGAPRIAVTWDGSPDARALAAEADVELSLGADLPEIVAPIALTLVFQTLGYYLGVERGYNPDTLRTDHLPNARAWLTAFPLGTH